MQVSHDLLCTERGLVCSAKGIIFTNIICAKYTLDERPSVFRRDKPIFSSERLLHKDYDSKGSVREKSLVMGLKGPDAKTNWLAVNRQS
jgi:hypothetical protein